MFINEGIMKRSDVLEDQAILYRLALWRIPGIGPSTFYEITKRFSDLRQLFESSSDELKGYGFSERVVSGLKSPPWQEAEKDLVWQQEPQHYILTWDDDRYPPLLKEIGSPPPLLFVAGDIDLLKKAQIAIVGSRNPTHAGRENTKQFTEELVEFGYCITSGLAIGIDSVSHQSALNKKGKTIAVLGTGIDVIYPASNKKLAMDIEKQGALVSEFPLSVKPHAQHFPRRNRIISGLSLGVLVIEAGTQSGSLITARNAIEQNREVFAIPGSIHNPLSRGCHELIRKGAKLVDKTQDILEEISTLTSYAVHQEVPKKILLELDNDQLLLLKCLEDHPVPIDVIIVRSGLNQRVITSLLLDLELKGIIISVPGGYIKAKG